MPIRRQLVKHLAYPLHERVKGQDTVAAFRRLSERQHWSEARLAAFQIDELQRLMATAFARSTFYRDRLRTAGFRPGDLRSVADLRHVPPLTKSDIRAHTHDMLTTPESERRQLVLFSTGGSTGAPVKFFVDRESTAGGWAACWRARSWWGLDWGHSWFWLWGSPIELSKDDWMRARIKGVRDTLLNRTLLSAFDMTDATMATYVRALRRQRPRYIYAYASAAHFLAEHVLRAGVDLSDCAPRVIFTTSDTLYPHMRDAIERAFHCKVANEYGSREGSFIAHQCPEGGFHIHSDRVIVEILDGDRPAAPGDSGEIVITVLDAAAMPFIRYRTGDTGALAEERCRCGRVFPVFRTLDGRTEDFLVARERRLIHGQCIAHLLKEIEGVTRYRVVQENTDALSLDVVFSRPADQFPAQRLLAGLKQVFGYPVAVEIRYVDSVPLSASGKYRPVTSRLAAALVAQP
jgi:phenylacetate-CoA ligase